MTAMLLANAAVVTPDGLIENTSLSVFDGMIKAIGSGDGDVLDCSGLTLVPGFIDVHIHGAVGVDVNAADVQGLMEVAAFLAKHGVTTWLPTLVPDSDANYARVIAAIDSLMEIQSSEPVAQAIGVHYEGVFASEKMCGALRPEFFKTFTGSELREIPRLRISAR